MSFLCNVTARVCSEVCVCLLGFFKLFYSYVLINSEKSVLVLSYLSVCPHISALFTPDGFP